MNCPKQNTLFCCDEVRHPLEREPELGALRAARGPSGAIAGRAESAIYAIGISESLGRHSAALQTAATFADANPGLSAPPGAYCPLAVANIRFCMSDCERRRRVATSVHAEARAGDQPPAGSS